MGITRRELLKRGAAGAAFFSTAHLVPNWIVRSASAIKDVTGENRVLVLLQLEGGNDGLNTVVPFSDPLYYENIRPVLNVPENTLHKIDDKNGLHPRLGDLAQLYGDGNLAVVQNVGYPNPDLSHFVSTDYWEQGRIASGPNVGEEGWMGRFVDETCPNAQGTDPLLMMGIGEAKVPGSLKAISFLPPAVKNAETYRLNAGQGLPQPMQDARLATIEALNGLPALDPNVDFIQRTVNVAAASIETIQNLGYVPAVTYPDTQLGRDLRLISQLIHEPGAGVRVLHARQSGYDTHANQDIDHPALLGDLNDALFALLSDLRASGEHQRVLVVTFSEFGRRVKENESNGTDHGAASMLFAAGGPVNGGIFGGQPDLMGLQKGNLIQTIDFRAVYSEVIREWFVTDPQAIFMESFDPVGFLGPPPSAVAAKTWSRYE